MKCLTQAMREPDCSYVDITSNLDQKSTKKRLQGTTLEAAFYILEEKSMKEGGKQFLYCLS